jgi:hypothetical protein
MTIFYCYTNYFAKWLNYFGHITWVLNTEQNDGDEEWRGRLYNNEFLRLKLWKWVRHENDIIQYKVWLVMEFSLQLKTIDFQ